MRAKDLSSKGLKTPKRGTIGTIALGIFSDDNVSVICENTIKLERISMAVLGDNSEVRKSFFGFKVCTRAIDNGCLSYKKFG